MPDRYELQLERAAERSLNRLPEAVYLRIESAIDDLCDQPGPRGALELEGSAPMYRIRIGGYRVIYAVFDEDRIVKILQVLKRDNQTCRNLDR